MGKQKGMKSKKEFIGSVERRFIIKKKTQNLKNNNECVFPIILIFYCIL